MVLATGIGKNQITPPSPVVATANTLQQVQGHRCIPLSFVITLWQLLPKLFAWQLDRYKKANPAPDPSHRMESACKGYARKSTPYECTGDMSSMPVLSRVIPYSKKLRCRNFNFFRGVGGNNCALCYSGFTFTIHGEKY
jgi:hypothetical protein